MNCNIFLLLLVLWPFVGSLGVLLAGKRSESCRTIHNTALAVTVVEAVLLGGAVILYAASPDCNMFVLPCVEGFGLNFIFDGFRIVYCSVTVFMWVWSTAISKEYFGDGANLIRFYGLSMWTFAATVGVFISGDMITTFTFFEIMSLASYAFVAHTEKKESLRAAETYLAVAVIGGLIMLMGVLMLNYRVGTLTYTELSAACSDIFKNGDATAVRDMYVAGALILLGFGAKAGMFPLHIWLPKAHPVAPAPASALLSGVLTKSGIFGVLVLCIEIFKESFGFGLAVVLLGVITMLIGALLAVFSTDLKRTLACSSVSQIGFILIGIGLIPLLGEECLLAKLGGMLYMVNHSMFKLTLFLCAAAIYMKCHMLNLNDIRGYGKNMPVLKVLFLIGALGISGVPLLSGYVSKTLIHEGIVEYIEMAGSFRGLFKTVEILFLVSGGMTFSYMLKLFHAIFVDEPEKDCKYAGKDKSISLLSYISIAAPALLIIVFGVVPKLFYGKLGLLMADNTFCASFSAEQLEHLAKLKIFSLENLKGSLISLGLGLVFYTMIRLFLTEGDRRKAPVYVNRWPKWLDLEELVYRPLLCGFFPWLFKTVGAFIAKDMLVGIWKFIMWLSKTVADFAAVKLLKNVWKFVMWLGSSLAQILANAFAIFISFLQRTVFAEVTHKKHPALVSMEEKYERAEEDYKIVSSGISFGLMLICIGLCITVFYLLHLLFM